jgi:hypothetical protein
MKKILVYVIASMFVLLSGSVFAGVPEIDMTGNLSVKAITADDYDGDKKVEDKVDRVDVTVDLSLSCDLTDDVAMKAKLRNASSQGDASNANLDAVLNKTEVLNVCLEVKGIADNIDVTIGRQEIGEKGNSLVFHDEDADGISLCIPCGPVNVSYLSINDEAIDDEISALTLSGKLGAVDVSVARYTDLVASGTNEILDVTLAGNIPVGPGIDTLIEYVTQSGPESATVERDATAMLIKLATTVNNVSCALTYLDASGDEANSPTENGDYTGVAPSMKLTEIFSDMQAGVVNDDRAYNPGVTNLNAIVLKLGLPEAIAGLDLGLAYGTYKKSEVPAGASDKIGTEINLTADYKHSDNVGVSLLLAQFSPDTGDKAIKIQAGMNISFE